MRIEHIREIDDIIIKLNELRKSDVIDREYMKDIQPDIYILYNKIVRATSYPFKRQVRGKTVGEAMRFIPCQLYHKFVDKSLDEMTSEELDIFFNEKYKNIILTNREYLFNNNLLDYKIVYDSKYSGIPILYIIK